MTDLNDQERKAICVRWPWKPYASSTTRYEPLPSVLAIHRRVEVWEMAHRGKRPKR